MSGQVADTKQKTKPKTKVPGERRDQTARIKLHCVDCGKPLSRSSFRGNRDKPLCRSCSCRRNQKNQNAGKAKV
jgi:hypothetical protein